MREQDHQVAPFGEETPESVATHPLARVVACQREGCGRPVYREGQKYCSGRCRFKAWDAEHPRVKQGDLFRPPVGPQFKGSTYVPKLDQVRLGRQLDRVFQFMLDHKNHTLNEIAQATGSPEASVSARLRDMRRPLHKKGMGLNIVRTRGENGLHFYKWERE